MSRTVFIIASAQDRAAAEALEDQIEASGGAAETASPSASDPLWLDAMAARMKEADAAALVASSTGRDDRDMRRALYLALLYDKPIAVGALGDAGLDALLDDGDLFVGTRFEADASGFARDLSSAVSISGAGGDGWLGDGADLDAGALKRLADRATSLAASAPQPVGRARDSLGFPHTPASMMARWRILAQQDDESAYELFREDYGDDPYFGPKVDEVLARYRRSRRRRGFGAVWSGLVGAAAATMMFAAYASVCVGGDCGTDRLALIDVSAEDELPDTESVAELRDRIRTLRVRLASARGDIVDAETLTASALERAEDAEARARRLERRVRELESASGDVDRISGDVSDLELELASAVAQAADANQRADRLQSRIRELIARGEALESENVSLRDQNAELEAALAARGPSEPRRSAEITINGEIAGAARLLVYYLERLDDENARRSESEFAELIGTAMLRRLDFSILQACVVSETDLLREADGLWGARTTEAFLRLDNDEAGDVIACVERSSA